ncbi:MAG: aminotransferase class V-fold PLP-dependent enzyme [Phycisphaerales bacterium]
MINTPESARSTVESAHARSVPQTEYVNDRVIDMPGVGDDHRPEPIIRFVAHRISEPARFPVRQGLTQLNNGSYGCCPDVVSAAQTQLRARLEGDPVHFFKNDLEFYADDARGAIGRFINAPAKDLALISNGTVAVSTVLNNLNLNAGDEILITDHEYMATMNELDKLCASTGAVVVTAPVAFPASDPDQVVDSILGAVTSKTKLVLLSHICSASALVLPVERIVPELRAKGIDVFLDGAHTPGQIPLDIQQLNPTWYAASCHKWLATPKGTGFVYTSPDRQVGFKPLALSCRVHELRDDRVPFLCDFDYMGTNDYTGNLVVPVAIEHMGAQLPASEGKSGWDALYQRNHDLVVAGAQIVCDAIGITQQVPESMIGTMVGIPLPGKVTKGQIYDDSLWDALYLKHNIQVPVWALGKIHPRVMRVSAQLYNTIEDFERLGEALTLEL